MVQKYQNEIAPIFYYGISTKTNEKDLKIPILQPPDRKHPYWMTLYVYIFEIEIRNVLFADWLSYFTLNINTEYGPADRPCAS